MDGVNQARAGKRALYFSRLTARNWNTTSKLLALLEEDENQSHASGRARRENGRLPRPASK
jgi:hypothetical protein